MGIAGRAAEEGTARLETDVGPVIDADALAMLNAHQEQMEHSGRLLCRAELGACTADGHFFAPVAFEIANMDSLEREVFGPILHVIRYKAAELERVIDAINASVYGLTLGIHSRIDTTHEQIRRRLRVGNIYQS